MGRETSEIKTVWRYRNSIIIISMKTNQVAELFKHYLDIGEQTATSLQLTYSEIQQMWNSTVHVLDNAANRLCDVKALKTDKLRLI